MRKDDIRLINSEQLHHGAILQRVINGGCIPYTLILVDEKEVWSCPTSEEARMISKWKKEGKRIAQIWRQ